MNKEDFIEVAGKIGIKYNTFFNNIEDTKKKYFIDCCKSNVYYSIHFYNYDIGYFKINKTTSLKINLNKDRFEYFRAEAFNEKLNFGYDFEYNKTNKFYFRFLFNGKVKILYTYENFKKPNIVIAKDIYGIVNRNYIYMEEKDYISFPDFIEFCKKYNNNLIFQ